MNQTATKRALNSSYRQSNANSVNNPELERLLMEKQHNEERLIKELAFKDESFHLLKNDHNLKLDQFELQINEEVLKMRRKFDIEIDTLKSTIIQFEGHLREGQSREQQNLIEIENLGLQLDDVNRQLHNATASAKEKDNIITQLSGELQGLIDRLKGSEGTNADMQEEILVLLQVEKDKQREIILMKDLQAKLRDKIESLGQAFGEIQLHLKAFSDKLGAKESECSQMRFLVSQLNSNLLSSQQTIKKLNVEVDQAMRRQRIREEEVRHLIKENERLYNELNSTRHRLHDIAITYNIPT